jgi:quercetin dioxygenase-like cupin family protein
VHITPAALPTVALDWGTIKWHVTPAAIDDASLTFGEVIVNTSKGHDPHSHPAADEVIYVVSGEGRQTVGEDEFEIRAGDAVWIPRDVVHSTYNTGWQPLRLIVTYTPGGEEAALAGLPDFAELPAGALPAWKRQG